MSSLVLQTAAEVIRGSSREKSADAVLRDVLKRKRDLSPIDRADVSDAVFSFYRWQEWTKGKPGLEAGLRFALELTERFKRDPSSVPVEELRAKAVPNWTKGEVAVSDSWLSSLQQKPKLWLRTKRERGKTLTRSLGRCRPAGDGLLADSLEYEGHRDLFLTSEFHAGEFELQDISSQAVGFICNPQPGETWWDACAGEGGKLLHLSDLMANKGLIWASDRAEWRLKKLKRRTARAKAFNYRSAVWNGGPKLPTKTLFDGVLIDAPCSGVGTWQRNPQARWTTTPEDVRELSGIQKELLANAAKAVKPGGRLIYSVCTLTRAETDEVADEFERTFTEFKPMPAKNLLAPDSMPSPRIWMWPQDSGGNGMFVAVWEKSK